MNVILIFIFVYPASFDIVNSNISSKLGLLTKPYNNPVPLFKYKPYGNPGLIVILIFSPTTINSWVPSIISPTVYVKLDFIVDWTTTGSFKYIIDKLNFICVFLFPLIVNIYSCFS